MKSSWEVHSARRFPLLLMLLLAGMLGAIAAAPSSAQPGSSPSRGVKPGGDRLAQTPPMGWNSWNHFGCDINEEIIKEMADAMVASGMKEAGYDYIVIDDCWMDSTRTAQGHLQADPERFPHGIKWLADYVHSQGLKLGIYESAGTKTCQGYPGSLDHEQTDAQTFAEWGIDYIKYDNCYNQRRPLIERYTAMQKALHATGAPIVYSICEWGWRRPWEWAPAIGHLWRTTGDIRDNWSSVMTILDRQVGLYRYAGPGHWNDPDMLEVGNGGMTTTEYRAHFSLWTLLAAPLMAGNDLRHMSSETQDILTNEEVIAVNQDPAGKQGRKIRDAGAQEVWVKPMSDGSRAVVLLNRSRDAAFMTTSARALDLPDASTYTIRDLWAHEQHPSKALIRARVPAHGAAMFRVWAGDHSE